MMTLPTKTFSVTKLKSFEFDSLECSRLLNAAEVSDFRLDPRRPNAVLCEPFEFRVNGIPFVLPEGFISDLGSIPWGLWSVFPPVDSRARLAFLIHDWGCDFKGWFIRSDDSSEVFLPKNILDELFLRSLEAGGVPFLKRRLMFRAIRLFGPRYSINS